MQWRRKISIEIVTVLHEVNKVIRSENVMTVHSYEIIFRNSGVGSCTKTQRVNFVFLLYVQLNWHLYDDSKSKILVSDM